MIKTTAAILTLAWLAAPAFAGQADGKQLYQANCAMCHGDHAQGQVGPKLAGVASAWPQAKFERAVLQGINSDGKPLKPPMPVWQNSSFSSDGGHAPSKQEVGAIYAYLQTL